MCGMSPCASPACTWSESHRQACEARYVIRLQKAKREEFYAGVAKKRGVAGEQQLRERVKTEWISQGGASSSLCQGNQPAKAGQGRYGQKTA